MRAYTQAERCMLLLFAPLGEEKPLSAYAFRGLRRMLTAMETAAWPAGGEVDAAFLWQLGVREPQCGQILGRLAREPELERHLEALARLGIAVVTRISPEYPRRLLAALGDRAPMLLYCAGALELFQTECVSLVGSRQLRPAGQAFAETLGRRAAAEGLTYVSGGALGADTVGFQSVMDCGGCAILFLPDSLRRRTERMAAALRTERLLLVSEQGFQEPFSTGRAHARNRLIHAMGDKVFVAQSAYGSGGTWQGTVENLNHGWSPVCMCSDEPEDPGTRGLIALGCRPVRRTELHDLRAISPAQIG